MRGKKISFDTLGCRYNRFESAEMAHVLENAGYLAVAASEPADVVVINTCAVTNKSAARCRAAIRSAREANPNARVVVTGCYSQTSPEAVAAVEGVDVVLGNAEKFDMAETLAAIESGGVAGPVRIFVGTAPLPETLPIRAVTNMEGRTNAYLNVQSGCDEVCSFCVVRFARGRSRSADPDETVDQVARMAVAGIREVVLTGINIGQYRHRGLTLAGLMRRIVERTNIPRIRLSSINPNDVTDELIDLMVESPRVCRHLHVPLQSGSDRILEKMRRPYTARMYEELLLKLAGRAPGIGLGADVMVGFPGETEEDFEASRALIERSPLMMLHVFAYSPREGTEASSMAGAPHKQEAKRRSAILKKMSTAKGRRFRSRFIGATMDTLIESSRDKAGLLKGFSDNYIPIALDGPDRLMNRIVPVRITGEEPDRLLGVAV